MRLTCAAAAVGGGVADAGLASTTMSAAGVDIGDGVGVAVILMATRA